MRKHGFPLQLRLISQWKSCDLVAILTGDPNELVAPIHERMTTFLEPRDYEEYLSLSERAPVHLLRIPDGPGGVK